MQSSAALKLSTHNLLKFRFEIFICIIIISQQSGCLRVIGNRKGVEDNLYYLKNQIKFIFFTTKRH